MRGARMREQRYLASWWGGRRREPVAFRIDDGLAAVTTVCALAYVAAAELAWRVAGRVTHGLFGRTPTATRAVDADLLCVV
jgi:hypothetical protein